MNPYKLAELEHKFLFDQEVSGDYLSNTSKSKEQKEGKPKITQYYCSECGNPIDALGNNIPKKRLSKWSFMNAKPYLGNCCNPY